MRLGVFGQQDDLDPIEADLIIVGGGAAGLSLARELFDSPIRILIVESGLIDYSDAAEALNTVEVSDNVWSEEQAARRTIGHGPLIANWSHDRQAFGVRVRGLGGSTAAWAGKSATFDPIDFEQRDWVPHSGWPITRSDLDDYYRRAAERLNLGPNVYDDGFWTLAGAKTPSPRFDTARLRTFLWQFSRSRTDPFVAMNLGPPFAAEPAENVRVLLGATATRILTSETGETCEGVEIAAQDGRRSVLRAQRVVLAASAIENARLLLVSDDVAPGGLGNAHDQVGRYLMDHAATEIGRFDRAAAPIIEKRFGFQGISADGRMKMYMHGMALAEPLQRKEHLLNCALFTLGDHAPDDPLEAFKRLLRGKSRHLLDDLLAVMRSPVSLGKSLGIKAVEGGHLPQGLQQRGLDLIAKLFPNFAVRETLHRGVQYRLEGMRVEGITEQLPDPDNRITLSTGRDANGVPLPHVHWRIDEKARQSLARLGGLFRAECESTGLPVPSLPAWMDKDRLQEAPLIDMAHTLGTTRMSRDPKEGVVDPDCQVHGVEGLFVAGGSVFTTSGHSNPTLTIVALAIRLADHLQSLPLA